MAETATPPPKAPAKTPRLLRRCEHCGKDVKTRCDVCKIPFCREVCMQAYGQRHTDVCARFSVAGMMSHVFLSGMADEKFKVPIANDGFPVFFFPLPYEKMKQHVRNVYTPNELGLVITKKKSEEKKKNNSPVPVAVSGTDDGSGSIRTRDDVGVAGVEHPDRTAKAEDAGALPKIDMGAGELVCIYVEDYVWIMRLLRNARIMSDADWLKMFSKPYKGGAGDAGTETGVPDANGAESVAAARVKRDQMYCDVVL